MAKTGATTYSISFYQKDGAFVSDRTVDLDGKFLHIAQGGINFLAIEPTVGFETANLQSYNITGNDNYGLLATATTNTDASAAIEASFNGAAKFSQILAYTDATTATLDYTADTHTFNGDTVLDELAGNGAGVVAVDNNGLLSWSAAGGGSFDYTQVLFAQVFS